MDREPAPARRGAVSRIVGAVAVVAVPVFVGLGVLMAFPDLVARHLVPPLLYYPATLAPERADPASAGLEGRQTRIRTEDGLSLHAWWIPAVGDACGAAIFFHGNAGHLADRAPIADQLSRRGFHALLVDYRGYGLSEGSPDEEGLYRDGEAAYRHLRDDQEAAVDEIAVLGHSLGGAVAAHVAASEPVGATVLTATFRDLPGLARDVYRWLPSPIFRDWSVNRFEVEERVRRFASPVLVARGAEDRLMPRGQTRGLYESAPDPKRWYEAPGADHNDLWWHEGFWAELDEFLRESLGCR